ncbi:MAG: transporter [Candidatus Marinimicrobia bacterium]|nr:transporter [Candidatus Neomarinimicrobiota bacterium]
MQRGFIPKLTTTVLFSIVVAVAQGPPINTNTAFVTGLNGSAIRTFGKAMQKTTLFSGARVVSNSSERAASAFAFPVMIPFEVIPNKLVVIAAVPYLSKGMELTKNGNRVSRDASGWGDLKLLGKYQFYQRDTRRATLRITFLGGIKLPTGKADASDEMGPLPRPLQLGSGSFDVLGGPIVTYVRNRIGLNVEGSYRKNSQAEGYQFGDVWSANLAMGYRIFPKVYKTYPSPYSSIFVELLSEFSGKDRKEGLEQPNTGKKILVLSPGVQFVFSRTFLLEASLQLPLYQYFNGEQLGLDYSYTFGLRWLIF